MNLPFSWMWHFCLDDERTISSLYLALSFLHVRSKRNGRSLVFIQHFSYILHPNNMKTHSIVPKFKHKEAQHSIRLLVSDKIPPIKPLFTLLFLAECSKHQGPKVTVWGSLQSFHAETMTKRPDDFHLFHMNKINASSPT